MRTRELPSLPCPCFISDEAGPSKTAAVKSSTGADKHESRTDESGKIDASYFDSYSHLDIHRDMLGDQPRTSAYRDALLLNPELLRGKVVLDVGCGTGILSMLAAKAGAAKVIGIDGSKDMAQTARAVVQSNGLEGVITIMHGKVEELGSIGVEQVGCNLQCCCF